MKNNSYTDEELIKYILLGNQEREKALKYLYQDEYIRKTVFQYVQRTSGDDEHAREVLQEAIIALDMKIGMNKFNAESTLRTYIVGIAKNKWREQLRARSKTKLSDEMETLLKDEGESMSSELEKTEDLVYEQQRNSLIHSLIDKLGEHCKEILGLYMQGVRMTKIAESKGYLGANAEQQAKNAAHRCKEQLRKLIEGTPNVKTFLMYNHG